jgi:hypothetical protein
MDCGRTRSEPGGGPHRGIRDYDVDAIESQNLGEVMKGGHGGLGHRLPAASNPEAGLSAVGAVLWRPRRDPARAKPLRRSYAIILAPSLMKLKPTRDELADTALGKKFTLDTALTWGAWVQWISFPRMDFFATMDSLLGPSGFGKRANRDAG